MNRGSRLLAMRNYFVTLPNTTICQRWIPFFFKINSWYYTRHRVWNRCQRQYYFEYIAQYIKSAAVVDPNKIRGLNKDFRIGQPILV